MHSSEGAYECIFCYKEHLVPEDGFPINKLVQYQLEIQLNTHIDEISNFEECKKIIQELKDSCSEVEVIQKDPDSYISDYFNEMKIEVYLRKDNLISEIDKCSYDTIAEIETAHQKCLAVKSSKQVDKDLEEYKKDLHDIIQKCDSFTFKINSKIPYSEMLCISEELKRDLSTLLENYKSNLLEKENNQLSWYLRAFGSSVKKITDIMRYEQALLLRYSIL